MNRRYHEVMESITPISSSVTIHLDSECSKGLKGGFVISLWECVVMGLCKVAQAMKSFPPKKGRFVSMLYLGGATVPTAVWDISVSLPLRHILQTLPFNTTK